MAHRRLRSEPRLQRLRRIVGIGLLASGLADVLGAGERWVRLERFTIDHGLASNSVRAIVQDGSGFLWLATHDGLHRFDGYGFAVYHKERESAGSLADDWIDSLMLDRSGALWIDTRYGGLHRLDPSTRSFQRVESETDDGPKVTAMLEDSKGRLWVGSSLGGLHLFDGERGQLVGYRSKPSSEDVWNEGDIVTIVEAAGSLVVATASGLYRLDEERRSFSLHPRCDLGDPSPRAEVSIGVAFSDRAGTLWLGGETSGLYRCDAAGGVLEHYQHRPGDPESFTKNRVTAIVEDRAGDLWIGTDAGELIRLERSTGSIVRYRNEERQDPLEHAVRALYEDRTGLLWIGTEDGGLLKLNRAQEAWRRRARPLVEAGIDGQHVMALHEDAAGRLWIGSRGDGLFRVERDRQRVARVKNYRHDPSDPNSLPLDYVSAIQEDSRGALWVGTYPGGLSRLDLERQEVGHFAHYAADAEDPASLSDNRVRAIARDSSGALWVGTRRGLCRLQRGSGTRGPVVASHQKGTFACYFRQSTSGGLADDSVRAIFEDREGLLWLGTDGGLSRLDRRGGKESFAVFRYREDDPASLSDNRIRVIYEDRAGRLWVGTRGGLNRFERETGTFRRYRGDEWLSSDVVYGIQEDEEGHLWLSTLAGLVRFAPDRERSRSFDHGDGLLNRGFEIGAHLRTADGLMLFGGAAGLDVFAPEAVTVNLVPPSLAITGFRPLGGTADHELPPGAPIRLPYRDRSWGFEFAALDFTHPGRNQYAYRLEGFDADWTYCGTRRFASYTNLPPGSYRLQIKGANSQGVWNEEGITQELTVVPPFWMRWWWRLSVAGLVVTLAVAAHRLRTHRISRRGRELEERNLALDREVEARRHAEAALRRSQEQLIMAQKMEAVGVLAGGVAHDFNNLLTAITGYSSLLLDRLGPEDPMRADLEEIHSAGERGAALTHQLLAFSRRQPLEPRPLDLNATVGNMERMLRPIIGEDIELVTCLDPELDPVEADEVQIEQVVMNLVVNARDGMPEGGRLLLRTRNVPADGSELAPSEPMVSLTVEDNGIGIEREALGQIFQPFFSTKGSGRGSGLGLAVVYGIVSQHQGWVEVESEPGAGSTFTVYLPASASSRDAVGAKVAPLEGLPRGRSERILLVEDEPAVRELVERTLRDNDYQVSAAGTLGSAAELVAQGGSFDLVLSDVVLPDGSGLTLVERLLARRGEQAVLLMSGYADPKSQWPVIRERGLPFIRKPFSRGRLLRAVRAALDRPEMADHH